MRLIFVSLQGYAGIGITFESSVLYHWDRSPGIL